jgi:hypothetical protein
MPTPEQIRADIAYRTDHRVLAQEHGSAFKGVDLKKMELTLELGDPVESVIFPVKYEVCACCEGQGTTTNPSMDANGLNIDELEDDQLDAYFSGAYDIPCPHCEGKRVEPVINREAAGADKLELYDEYSQDEYEAQQTYIAEARMGC